MRIYLIMLILAVLFHEFSCQDRPTKNARKKQRTKTTASSAIEPDGVSPDTTRLPEIQPIVVDEVDKPLSGEANKLLEDPSKLSPITGSANSTNDKNPHQHIPPPFIYASEKLNKTHANMFKR